MSLVRGRERAQSIIVINVHFKRRFKTFILTGEPPKNLVKRLIKIYKPVKSCHGLVIFKFNYQYD